MEWTLDKKVVVRALLVQLKKERPQRVGKLLSRNTLFKLLTPTEQKIINELTIVDPKQYGFNGPYYGVHEPQPTKLLLLPKAITEGGQCVHVAVHTDLSGMLRAMHKEIGHTVVVISAYRSPAYQALLFLEILARNNFNMQKTCKRVALPGWSEHGAIKNQAVDFGVESIRGKQKPTFGTTAQYRWLKRNAHRFNFYLSYPRNNAYGVMFEPWHWHWEPK